MKGEGCTDGRPQRDYISKLESSAPKVKTHTLFLTCERRKVMVADIPGAFLSADWPKDAPDCYIQFDGVMIGMICQLNPGIQGIHQVHQEEGWVW